MDLEEEQRLLRACIPEDKEENVTPNETIEVSAATIDRINNNLLKACEAIEERNKQSWIKASEINAGN